MTEKTGHILIGILIGIVSAVILFCLIVCIGSAVNGVTFGTQVANWFNSGSAATTAISGAVEGEELASSALALRLV